MVQNKKLVEELKKYNNALEKHFSNLDFESLSGLSSGSGSSETAEFYSLVASNIMDMKTEMALIRKNLSVEIEGMVGRVIADEQKLFIEQMNKFYGKIIFELKENLNSHVKEINSDVVELKRDINEVTRRNVDFSKTLENFSTEIYDFKQSLVSLEELSVRNANSKELFTKFERFENKVDKLLFEITKKNSFFENNLVNINKKLASVETEILGTDKIILNEKALVEKDLNQNQKEFENIDNKFREVEKFLFKIDELSKNPNKNLLNNENTNQNKNIILNKHTNEINDFENIRTQTFDSKQNEKSINLKNKEFENEIKLVSKSKKLESKIGKILEIDKRLQKLESLR